MTSETIRQRFAAFFEKHRHRSIPSSSLIPDNDPSVLLTTAGMQQFKPYFLGEKNAEKDFGTRRLTSVQRCFRTSDIEEVGDASHNTFFEMLGNFSIGDYFKKEAIELAWEFLTKEVRLPAEQLWITIFAGDQLTPRDTEAERFWLSHLPHQRIIGFGREDNFWGPSGTVGPCGPSSEIHLDRTGQACERQNDCRPNCSCGRFMEIWNLVFTELEKRVDGSLHPLKEKNIDTGMGLERLALALQRVPDIFATDAFSAVLKAIDQTDQLADSELNARTRRRRIIADHLRAAVFLIADGVLFSNKDQGYVLRRIVRRALDQFSLSQVRLEKIVDAVIQTYEHAAPHLAIQRPAILDALAGEQAAYQRLTQVEVEKVLQKMRKASPPAAPSQPSSRQLTADEAFRLFSTYGLSLNRLVRDGFSFDRTAFDQLVRQHQASSRSNAEAKFGGHGLGHAVDLRTYSPADVWKVTQLHTATHLLHAALRRVLGNSVRQNGSDITPERLRFDFTFSRKLTDEEKRQVEDLVNQKISENLPVKWEIVPYQQALGQGALGFFKEKYANEVKVYTLGDFSKELCGGPHVEQTSQVGHFHIISEKSSAAGIRRIKAVTQTGLDREKKPS